MGDNKTVPPLQHVALIMDGNGRWAQARQQSRTEGHKAGAKRVFEVVKHAFDHWHIPYVTLYAFSTENWKRPAYEVNLIFRLVTTYLKRKKHLLLENKIRFRVLGDYVRLPQASQAVLREILEATQGFSDYTLSVALNYGAREEVLHAIASLTPEEMKHLDWETLAQHLYTRGIPDPDLIVRTSGEQRLSNYLLLQSAYSELYFTPTPWPDFFNEELDKAIEDYLRRKRRFGDIK